MRILREGRHHDKETAVNYSLRPLRSVDTGDRWGGDEEKNGCGCKPYILEIKKKRGKLQSEVRCDPGFEESCYSPLAPFL